MESYLQIIDFFSFLFAAQFYCYGKKALEKRFLDFHVFLLNYRATSGAFYLAVQPGRMAFSLHAVLVSGHLA